MPITPSNPPNYTSNPQAAIPVYIASGDVNVGYSYVKNGTTSLTPTSTSAQPVLGLTNGVTLAAGQRFYVEGGFFLEQIANANNHTETIGFTSSATLNAISVQINRNQVGSPSANNSCVQLTNTGTLTGLAYTASGNSNYVNYYHYSGYITTAAGSAVNVNPVIVFGANSGTSSTVLANAWFRFTPSGVLGSNFAVGTWT